MHDCIKFGAVFEYSHVYSHIRVALKMNIGNHHLLPSQLVPFMVKANCAKEFGFYNESPLKLEGRRQ